MDPKNKTKLACILEFNESRRMRMGNPIPHHHEDHIADKKRKITTVLQFGSQVYSYASSFENSCSKWDKLEKISAWNLTRVRSKKQVIDEARTSGATIHSAS